MDYIALGFETYFRVEKECRSSLSGLLTVTAFARCFIRSPDLLLWPSALSPSKQKGELCYGVTPRPRL
ncbi:Hypothetical protein SMAX5B_005018 [Scophthalmus maximus]|uniref:Uncharacterized protein n=1 Tax=Scophthalmus maximus TaxID=52904 RepID=A0A2U9AZG8_SCOMX|nr:Hypothetical protein SMAX5B_005018 [Scophthalmus maximus]